MYQKYNDLLSIIATFLRNNCIAEVKNPKFSIIAGWNPDITSIFVDQLALAVRYVYQKGTLQVFCVVLSRGQNYVSAYKAWSRNVVVRVLTMLQKWREITQAYTQDMVASPSAIFVIFRNDSLNHVVNCVPEPYKGATCFFNLSKICVSHSASSHWWNMLVSRLKENDACLWHKAVRKCRRSEGTDNKLLGNRTC
jgi:hypothetical protein